VVKKLVPNSIKKPINPDGEKLFRLFPTLMLKEFAVLGNYSEAVAASKLQELESAGKIEKFKSKNGPIWKRR
jgi:hypothetical protein